MSKDFLSLMLIFQVLQIPVTESEPSLSQSPFIMTAEVGDTVELTCQYIYEVDVVSSFIWYQQRMGEAPKLIDNQSCKGVNCKFISKKGNNKHQLILKIRNVQVNDAGSYYCTHRYTTSPLQNGPNLLVGDSSSNKTAVLVFVPPGELHLRKTVSLVCLVIGVSSKQIAIFWNISGLVTEGPRDTGTVGADGTYSIRSHVTVSRETWRSGSLCTCIVQLGSLDKYLTKSVSFRKAEEAGPGWCRPALPVIIPVLVILVLLLVLSSIWILKSSRSGERGENSHNENFSLRERRQRDGLNEGQTATNNTDDHRQTEAKRTHQSAIQTQGGPFYTSLDLAAWDKRPKKT